MVEFQSSITKPKGLPQYFFGFSLVCFEAQISLHFYSPMNVLPPMLAVFRDAIRWVNDRNLLELRARFVALDDTAKAISAIDSEVSARKRAYYAPPGQLASKASPVVPGPFASGAKQKKLVALDVVEAVPDKP